MDEQNEDIKQVQESVLLDIKEIRELQKKAKKQIDTISQLASKSEVLREKLTNSQGGIEANILVAQEGSEKIQSIKSLTDQLMVTLQTQAQEISDQVNQSTAHLEHLETITKQGEADTNTVKSILNEVNISKEQIENIKAKTIERSTSIEENYQTVLKNLEAIRQTYEDFIVTKSKIDDPVNGLESILTLSSKLKDEIAQARTNSEDSLRQIKKVESEIEQTKNQTNKSRQVIEANKKTSEEFKSDIGKILSLVTDSSLADGFNTRKKELADDAKKWILALTFSWILLVVAVIYFFKLIPGKEGLIGWEIAYRTAFTSPFVFALLYCAQQFGKNRDLLEKYAFKLTISLSLQSYIKLLNDSFPSEKYKQQLLQFTRMGIEKIYKEPYIERNRKYGFGINKIFNIGIEESDLSEIEDKIIKTVSDKVADKK